MANQWRIFGNVPSRASDFELVLWVRCLPSPLSACHLRWPLEASMGLPEIWDDVLDEIEFRNLLPLRGWSEWYRAPSII